MIRVSRHWSSGVRLILCQANTDHTVTRVNTEMRQINRARWINRNRRRDSRRKLEIEVQVQVQVDALRKLQIPVYIRTEITIKQKIG